MATGDIIQKDLGLVTAYGYALAGGYTGSEEQFKIDFANLMSGKYSGSELKQYRGRYEVEPFTSSYGTVDSYIAWYGNISYFTMEFTASVSIDTSKEYDIATASGDISDMAKYMPIAGYGDFASVCGFNYDTGIATSPFSNYYSPSISAVGIAGGSKMVKIILYAKSGDSTDVIDSGSRCRISAMFINSVGV